MSIPFTAPKSSKLLRLLRVPNPKPPQASFIHLATEKPSHHPPPKGGDPSSSSSLSSPIVTQIVELIKANDNGNWKANDQLHRLLSSDSHSLSSDHFVQITRRLCDSSTALNFFEYLRSNSYCPDYDSLSFVFQAVFELASREPNWRDKLIELLDTSKELNVPLSVYSATLLIRCFGRARMVDKSMVVYDLLDTEKRNTYVRNSLVDELLRSGRLDDALQVLDEMLQRNVEFPPNKSTGDIVFGALLKGEKYNRRIPEEEIVELVSKFGSHCVFPDTIRLTQWITRFCRNRRNDKAWELLHVVMELNGPIEAASCNALLTSLGKEGQFKKMNLLMEEMKKKAILPNVVTLGISINHLCKSGRLDEALVLFEKMRQGEVGVPIEPDVVIYNTLIDGLCKVGRAEEGLALMRGMGSDGNCSPSTATYNCLIDGFCKAGEIERSLELFQEMNKQGVEPNVITVNTLVDGMCRHGRAGGALEFYHEMKENGLEGNVVTYTALISGFCGVNNISKAMELYDEMRKKYTPDATVYYTLISGLAQAGRMDDAHSVFLEIKGAGFHPDIACYKIIINGFCKKNKFDKVSDLLKEMQEAELKLDSHTYNTLISYFSKIRDLKMAHRVLRQMVNDALVPTVVTYGALIHACCSVGELDEALKIFREMSSSSRVPPNTVIYNTLIDSLCRNKKVKVALSLLDDMKVKEVYPNTNTFNSIFKALQEENWIEKAFELMDRMIEQACNPDYITLEVLTEWLSAVGEADKLKLFVQGYKVSTCTM